VRSSFPSQGQGEGMIKELATGLGVTFENLF
jgi:hypothetical protein